MFPNNPINQDHRIQFLNLRFNFSPQAEGELPVHVTSLGDNTQYFARFPHNPHLTFNQIRNHLQEGHFTILTKNQDIFKISIQQVQTQFLSMSQLQINDLKDVNDQIIEEIKQMLETREIRIANKIRDEIQKLQINQLKIGINECAQSQQQFRMIVQSQNDSVEDLKDSIQRQKFQIKRSIQQVKRINQESFKNEIQKLQIQLRVLRMTEARNQFKDKLNRQQNKMNKNESDFKKMKKQIQQDSLRKQKLNNKIQNWKKQLIKLNLNQVFNQSEERMNVNSFQWSQRLKSDEIKINGNVVTRTTKYNGYWQFCLLNASFSNTLKTKQSWAIQINKMTDYAIYLGVCLKSKILNNNFNSKNINWEETGHGLYMVGSFGRCFSHSQKEFNWVKKSFDFGDGDMINIEYDPINKKLKFYKNKIDGYYEFVVIVPTQNDAYHPCVALCGQNSSVELIQPLKYNLNSQRNNEATYLFNRYRQRFLSNK